MSAPIDRACVFDSAHGHCSPPWWVLCLLFLSTQMGNRSPSPALAVAPDPSALTAAIATHVPVLPKPLVAMVVDYLRPTLLWSAAGSGPGAFELDPQSHGRTFRVNHRQDWQWAFSDCPVTELPHRFALRVDANPCAYRWLFGLTPHTPHDLQQLRREAGGAEADVAASLCRYPLPRSLSWLVDPPRDRTSFLLDSKSVGCSAVGDVVDCRVYVTATAVLLSAGLRGTGPDMRPTNFIEFPIRSASDLPVYFAVCMTGKGAGLTAIAVDS
jgi:hypothetical protein